MQLVAVLSTPAAPLTPSAVLAEPLLVGGITVFERQLRQVRRAGATRVIVVGPRDWRERGDDDLVHVADAAALARLVDERVTVLLVASGLVLDERIVRAMAAAVPPAVATWPARATGHAGTERIDVASVAAGVGTYPGAMVRDAAIRLGDWDLASTVLRTALTAGAVRVDLSALPPYVPDRRRDVPLLWAQPLDTDGAHAATAALIAAAQKGCLDWPARFIHPALEDAAVRLLLPTPVTPNMVTVANVVVAVAAGIAFAYGWLWVGLVLALVCGPLDGVDGKLARTRLEFSKFGELEHVLDKVAEYGWFAAIAAHFAAVSGSAEPWALATLLIGFALAESLQGEFFRRFTGGQLDDAGRFERGFRLVAGRRNTLFWTWLPFAAAGAWYAGFAVMAAYTVATFFVMQFRFFKRLGDYGRDRSPVVASNFADTAYELLAAPPAPAPTPATTQGTING